MVANADVHSYGLIVIVKLEYRRENLHTFFYYKKKIAQLFYIFKYNSL